MINLSNLSIIPLAQHITQLHLILINLKRLPITEIHSLGVQNRLLVKVQFPRSIHNL